VPALSDTRWTDLRGDEARLLVVPVGATEQHGPHLPLTTDTEIAVALAAALDREREDVALAPPVAFGSSGEHQAFPGTLSIGREATELLLVELGRSATESFARILFVSAHGGNFEPVASAVHRLRDEGRDVLAWSPRWGGDLHAGHVETSIMLALASERVRPGLAVRGDVRPLQELLAQMRLSGVRSVSQNGVLGDATTASAEAGRTLLRRASADLAELVRAWPGGAAAPAPRPAEAPGAAVVRADG
jgi:creatinine amidohydrolase